MFYGLVIICSACSVCLECFQNNCGNYKFPQDQQVLLSIPRPSSACPVSGWFIVIHNMGVFVLPTTTLREGSIYWNDLHHIICRWPGNYAQAWPLSCPYCAEADRLHMLFVKMKGGHFSSHCDILHTKLPHYYTWNRRTWTLPYVGMSDVRVSCGGDQGRLGFIILPTQVLPLSRVGRGVL